MMYVCVYCETEYIKGENWCAKCNAYDGMISADYGYDGEVIDYYAEASLFGDA